MTTQVERMINMKIMNALGLIKVKLDSNVTVVNDGKRENVNLDEYNGFSVVDGYISIDLDNSLIYIDGAEETWGFEVEINGIPMKFEECESYAIGNTLVSKEQFEKLFKA